MRLATCLAGVALLAAPVAAQQTGTRIGKTAEAKDAELVMQVMMSCVADRWPDEARALLQTVPGSPEEVEGFKKLGTRAQFCMGGNDRLVTSELGGLKMRLFVMRRWLGSAMFLRSARPFPATVTAPADAAWFGGRVAAAEISTNEAYASYSLAQCVIGRDWAGVRALLTSEAATQEERAAMKALTPSVVPCVPHDYAMTIRPAFLRGILGETAYYLTVGNGAGAVGKN